MKNEFIQITSKGVKMGIAMFGMLKIIFEIAKSENVKNINDININQLLKGSKFRDENGIKYSKHENKEIIKKLIHLYVGLLNNFNQFGTDNIDEILEKIDDTLLKIEKIS